MFADARRAAAGLIPPLLILGLSLWLRGHIAVNSADLKASRGMFGPGFWPALMLAGISVCAAGWLAMNLLSLMRRNVGPATAPAATTYDMQRAVAGVAIALTYGILIPPLGFALATLLFVTAWMLLGGFRRPIAVAAVALLGVAGTLWFFAGVALMPLDLGKGAFETATIAVYKALRIY